MFELINKHVMRCSSLTQDELQLFNNSFDFRTYPRKTLLLRAGEICDFEAYINKGCVRSYFINEEGAEVTLQFALEDWWVSDIASFYERVPSKIFIETLEECDILIITPDSKENLLRQVPKFERIFRIMIQRNLARLQERLFLTITTDGKQKYLDFMQRYPQVIQRVPQHYIASYLGITPEFLSKVRKKITEENK
jgi:CRP-like cAMP-binding protein